MSKGGVMNSEEILAYGILSIFYMLVVIPFVGSLLTNSYSSLYSEDWKAGTMIHLVIFGLAGIFIAVIWAVLKVL